MTFLRSILPIATWAGVVAASIFQLTIFDTDSTLNGQAVNAAGGAFYLGLSEPSSYCPSGTTQCPEVTTTLFAGMDALWVYRFFMSWPRFRIITDKSCVQVEVPGGQQVYVTSSGAISFTPAHSETLPPDVAQGAFTNITVVSDCAAPLAIFNWENSVTPATGSCSCPYLLII
jgi:hypothetical protein